MIEVCGTTTQRKPNTCACVCMCVCVLSFLGPSLLLNPSVPASPSSPASSTSTPCWSRARWSSRRWPHRRATAAAPSAAGTWGSSGGCAGRPGRVRVCVCRCGAIGGPSPRLFPVCSPSAPAAPAPPLTLPSKTSLRTCTHAPLTYTHICVQSRRDAEAVRGRHLRPQGGRAERPRVQRLGRAPHPAHRLKAEGSALGERRRTALCGGGRPGWGVAVGRPGWGVAAEARRRSDDGNCFREIAISSGQLCEEWAASEQEERPKEAG